MAHRFHPAHPAVWVFFLTALSVRAQAPAGDEKDDPAALRKRIEALEREVERLKAQRPPAPAEQRTPEAAGPAMRPEEKKKLEEEFMKALGGEEKKAAPLAPPAAAPAGAGAPLNLIEFSLDLLSTGGVSSVRESEMRRLEAGGHDPKNRGFTAQNVELTAGGVVDPYFRGDANIVWQITEEGETSVELEEVYLTTLSLPAHLQVKGGQFFTAFGRLNPIHPHAWDFVDQPVVGARLLGHDGVRNPGVQLSWLTPLPFFTELTGSVQDAHGETAASFRGVPGDAVAGRTLVNRDVRSAADLLYLARLKTSFDLSDELTIVPGTSALFGPNASAFDARTQIYGVDLYAKWKPLTNDQGWPFVSWQTEAMLRRYEAGPVVVNDVDDDGLANGSLADGTVGVGRETLHDWGLYTQVVWGFARPWVVGVRYDYAAGEGGRYDLLPGLGVDRRYDSDLDPLRDRRHRVSTVLTYYPSEFSKLRLQYAYDNASFLDEAFAHSAWLQFEIQFGKHGAHKF